MAILQKDHPATGFRIACELFELGCEIMKQNLRRSHGELDGEALSLLLAEWLRERPGAELGDSPGRVILLPEDR
ncbi:MAG: hypothetical protein RBU30_24735 [Polyangia bacterium]|jgi:hypothetical protein|nr:hypothetical protein [Polyangia bacterium]